MTVEAGCVALRTVIFPSMSAELIELGLVWKPAMFDLKMVGEALCGALQRIATLRAWTGVHLEEMPEAPLGFPALSCTFRILGHCRLTPELSRPA